VASIHINDLDRSIYAFWYSILNKTTEFCNAIKATRLTVNEWKKQKEIQKNKESVELFDLGYSTFYLNRTNRSGIISAGLIGGLKQNGTWKMDARFNKEELINRIKLIENYKDRITLHNVDAITLINELSPKLKNTKTLFYLDPPYYNKGKELYVNYYLDKDHIEISKVLSKLKKHCWILTYDNTPEIKKLYNNFRQKEYSLTYSAAHASTGKEIIVFCDKLNIPDIINPTKTNEIKKKYVYI
jgi:DNA adenine methylase